MLRRYNFQEKVLFLERDGEAYYVTIAGVVTRYKNHEVNLVEQYFRDGEIYLKLVVDQIECRLANVMNFAFKGNLSFAFNELMRRNVIYIDDNPNNLNLENLIWSNENASEDEEGFRIIPGYSRYKINRKGVVKNYVRETEQSSYVDKYGYTFFGMTPDCGKRLPVGLHRLMAFSYLPIPKNFYEMDVNHIDGVKSNCDIPNLEWVTRLENNLHAVKIGLRNDNKVVLVRDVRTDIVTEYFSLAESRRALGLGKNVAETRVKTKGQKTFRDFTQFCLKSEFVNWGDIDLERDLFISGTPQRIKITNQENDGVTIYSSISEAASALGLQSGTISFRLNRTPPVWKDDKFIFEKII